MTRRVLVVKMSSLGDVVHALPAVSDAAAQGAVIDWVVEEAFADIPRAHPGVCTVIPVAWRRWRRNLSGSRAEMREFFSLLRENSYDLIIDSQGLIKSAVVALLARGRRSGYAFTSAREPWSAFAYGRGYSIPRHQHAIDRQRQLFAAALGYDLVTAADSGLDNASVSTNKVILLHGTTWATKHWPVGMWSALAQQIKADGFEPVVTWGDARERQRAEYIVQASGATMQDRVALGELRDLLFNAAAVIGVDSGLCHYAAALGTPTLGLYGPTDGLLTGARGQRAGYLQATAGCSPCLDKRCRSYSGAIPSWQGQPVEPPCFAALPPKLVWQRTQALMRRQG